MPGSVSTPLAEQASDAILGANPFVGIDPRQLALDLGRAVQGLAVRPWRLASVLAAGAPQASIDGDRRFADPAWSENPIYRRLGAAYVQLAATGHRMVDESGLDPLSAQRAHFAVGLLADALAPTNSLLTNPAALKHAFDTAGASLVRGARNIARDVRENGGMPSTVDSRPFEVGRNVATSPGAVVYRDEVFELIQYRPTTEEIYERPVVVIPPQINKFYVLDLAPGRSFTEYAVANGLPYFAISWRNPTAAQRDWGLARYVRACVEAIDVATSISRADAANVVGLCAGGVTQAMVLAASRRKIASATFAVSMLDLKSPSMVGMLASDAVVAMALRRSRSRGVLDGAEMARVFAWMRPNDLVWNYWVNNYLMGNAPPAFDILAWNADTTRLPAALHADFLDLYVRNPLPESRQLKRVTCPSYVVAGMTDHIVPWKAAYRTTQIIGGQAEFVLSSSGHIQSIVNPPGNPKASYRAGRADAADPDEWLGSAYNEKGSWWEHWVRWVGSHSGEKRPAPNTLGNRKFRSRGKAPGKYVLER